MNPKLTLIQKEKEDQKRKRKNKIEFRRMPSIERKRRDKHFNKIKLRVWCLFLEKNGFYKKNFKNIHELKKHYLKYF